MERLGLGGDIFIIDDPQKPIDAQSDIQRNRLNQWVSNTLMSRLDRKETGIIIVVMQRAHLNDLSGYLTESEGWTVLSLPAIAEQDETIAIGDNEFHLRRTGEALHPELKSLESLKELQRTMIPDDFAAQYQQSPVPPGGAMISARMAPLLPGAARADLSRKDHTIVGHGLEGWSPKRLVGLHNLARIRQPLLFARPHPRPLRLPKSEGNRDRACPKVSSATRAHRGRLHRHRARART